MIYFSSKSRSACIASGVAGIVLSLCMLVPVIICIYFNTVQLMGGTFWFFIMLAVVLLTHGITEIVEGALISGEGKAADIRRCRGIAVAGGIVALALGLLVIAGCLFPFFNVLFHSGSWVLTAFGFLSAICGLLGIWGGRNLGENTGKARKLLLAAAIQAYRWGWF